MRTKLKLASMLIWMYSQLNSSWRAPIQSGAKRIRMDSATAQPAAKTTLVSDRRAKVQPQCRIGQRGWCQGTEAHAQHSGLTAHGLLVEGKVDAHHVTSVDERLQHLLCVQMQLRR